MHNKGHREKLQMIALMRCEVCVRVCVCVFLQGGEDGDGEEVVFVFCAVFCSLRHLSHVFRFILCSRRVEFFGIRKITKTSFRSHSIT